MPRKKKNIIDKTVEVGKKGGEVVAEKFGDMTNTKNKRGRKRKR